MPADETGQANVRPSEADMRLDEGGAQPASEAPNQIGSSSIWLVIRMVLVLALAAAAIYGLVFLIRKISRPAQRNDPHIKILSTAHLGSNRFVHVVSVGAKAYLIGACDGAVNLLSEIDDQEAVDAMLLDDSRKTAEGFSGRFLDFRSMLQRLTGADSGAGGEAAKPNADRVRRNRDRIKGL